MRTTFMLSLSETLKEELQTYAQQHNISASLLIRQAISKFINYDLAADEEEQALTRNDRRGRPKIYESKEARLAAQKARNKERYQVAKSLLEQFEAQQAQRDREALANSIKDK